MSRQSARSDATMPSPTAHEDQLSHGNAASVWPEPSKAWHGTPEGRRNEERWACSGRGVRGSARRPLNSNVSSAHTASSASSRTIAFSGSCGRSGAAQSSTSGFWLGGGTPPGKSAANVTCRPSSSHMNSSARLAKSSMARDHFIKSCHDGARRRKNRRNRAQTRPKAK